MIEKTQILIVEDEKQIARFIQMELEHEGYECSVESNGAAALDRIGQDHFDLILLDVMLPDLDGLTICQRTRELSNVPIMMLSAKDDIETKVTSLDLGANDYLTKPFNSKELFARIRVLLREREIKPSGENFLQLQDMTLYLERHEVAVGEHTVILTKKEFELLTYLIRNKNIVLTRDRILEEVWGYDYVGDTNVVDVYIRYIRSKIGSKKGREYIHTIRGVGYVAKD
ncbi:PhoB family transcriptional regulator [Megasphaera cerevisiae DSM 20462]|jgi:DNA-binding response OmpR family regulator|uniref:PhoB family transcriptional regulator n=1 Tax=Megasphaera cerevisiae DSM 20462 TaxID=1122219 RepID=A0A0J6WVT1_9FIRM|nr:response regulator transcription factor [Megasphaera cerevisiae]KMO86679.1 PhoB family transcriptional regulator [Megasphaera cerevisiae DSM 20462]MCI1750620.1 response regulator transcription factor [Megasphaera cerevisiae]OKY52353.1 DNA-binding response regulator [Megasphaera cerevisiae]SJZ87040.1 DNA-binding response regulator, OmpR family, contains REC and winged-helix (wHTH) domain [Megasphaera cerevisiae DSM 20462]